MTGSDEPAPDADRLWHALVDAERSVRGRRAEIYGLGAAARTEILSSALTSASNWDRASALTFLRSFPEDVPALLPEILNLAMSHRWASEAREAVAAGPRNDVIDRLRSQITSRLPGSDADDYRRLAEVLVRVEAWDLLAELIRSALDHAEEDFTEIASDFSSVYRQATQGVTKAPEREP